jgi:type I restriction enzyme, R subunit
MVKNIAIVRVVGSMGEFKQIIGRGTRVRDDYGKYFFTILDYTGSASRHFADPEFDGDPALVEETHINDEGEPTSQQIIQPETNVEPDTIPGADMEPGTIPFIHQPPEPGEARKYYVDGGVVEIAHELVSELDADGKQLRVVRYTEYTAEKVHTLFATAAELRQHWMIPDQRAHIIEQLADRGIDFEELARVMKQSEADPFDLLCHVAFNAPLRTRRERADRLRRDKRDFFDQFGPEARTILQDLLEKYAEYGLAQFKIPEVLKVPPISERGNISEIIRYFGGAKPLRQAVADLQTHLYAA